MNIFITNFLGVLLTFMIFLNSGLTTSVKSMVVALFFIHVVGLIGTIAINVIKKDSMAYKKSLPFYLYLGGVLGVITVSSNSLAFVQIGASLTATLALLGQTISSILVDSYGLQGTPKQPFNKKKLLGISVILAGIIVMEVF